MSVQPLVYDFDGSLNFTDQLVPEGALAKPHGISHFLMHISSLDFKICKLTCHATHTVLELYNALLRRLPYFLDQVPGLAHILLPIRLRLRNMRELKSLLQQLNTIL